MQTTTGTHRAIRTALPSLQIQARLRPLLMLGGGLALGASQVAVAATALGEIQDRPAPVFRCPGLPCAVPNVFNITVAVQYDAPPADLTAIQQMISDASAVLFDVTDGQAQIGEAFIYNNAFSTAADLRVYPNTADTWWQANTGNWKVGGSMHVSINRILAAGAAGESLAHEFVHLVFDARDEYESRAVGCGDLAGGASCPTAGGETPCLMDSGGNGASSELCWSGNHEPALITEHSRCRSDRSCWEQLLWSWPDHFTAPAGGPDPAAGGAVVDPTSFVVADATVRVVLVLDESGSMSLDSPTRMERLKVAASDFVTLAESGTELGIVSFSSDAEPASGHASVPIAALGADRSDWTDAIDNLTPGGATAIGDGLEKARDMIIAAGGVTASTFIVLMTDGVNNRPLPDPAGDLDAILATLLADGIPVYVTCTGGDFGLGSQCSEIAAATGGFYADSAQTSDLAPAFTDLHEKISGREGIDSARGQLLEAKPAKVFVEAGSESATFALMWEDPQASARMTVIDPLGNAHPSLPMPQGRYTRLKVPVPGDYTIQIDSGGSVNSPYVVQAYTKHQINSLLAAPRHPTVLPGEPLYLYAYPRSTGGGITHPTAGISGTVLLPNGTTDSIVLFDQGGGPPGDDLKADGVFTGVYMNTAQKGPYHFHLRADISAWQPSEDGEDPGPPVSSTRFTREVRLSAAVGEPGDVARPTVSIRCQGSLIIVAWSAPGTRMVTLERAKELGAAWETLQDVQSPLELPAEGSGFFRARAGDSVSEVVGFVVRTVPPGFSMVANPFEAGKNSLAEVIPDAPDGTRVFLYDADGGGFATYLYDELEGAWLPDGNALLEPGDGCFVRHGGREPLRLCFAGRVLQGLLKNPVPAGFSIQSSQVPQNGTPADLRYPAGDGDLLYTFDPAGQQYRSYIFDALEGNWLPSPPPQLEPGQSFWLHRHTPTVWEREFVVAP